MDSQWQIVRRVLCTFSALALLLGAGAMQVRARATSRASEFHPLLRSCRLKMGLSTSLTGICIWRFRSDRFRSVPVHQIKSY